MLGWFMKRSVAVAFLPSLAFLLLSSFVLAQVKASAQTEDHSAAEPPRKNSRTLTGAKS